MTKLKQSQVVKDVCDHICRDLPEKYQNAFHIVVKEDYFNYYLYLINNMIDIRLKTSINDITEELSKQFLTHIIEKVKEEYRNQTILKLAGIGE